MHSSDKILKNILKRDYSIPNKENNQYFRSDKHEYGIESSWKDTNDWSKIKNGIDKNKGFDIGKYIQTPPILFSRDGHNIWLGDLYKGCSAFLILSGPSFLDIDKTILNKAGLLTMGVNNSVKTFRPNLWICVDNPMNFIKSIWLDPKIMKFVPLCNSEENIFDNETWKETNKKVSACPNVIYYRRNEQFSADRYLWENTVNWGNHTKLGGGRSVLLAALRILFYIGIRKVYLLGCDFKMDDNRKYHFDQDRSKASINGNNASYEKMRKWFKELNPLFLEQDYRIYNCNKDSKLDVFPFKSFKDAVQEELSNFPSNLDTERTLGLYERKKLEEKNKQKEIKK